MYSWSTKHPNLIINNADNPGGLAVRHREITAEAPLRGDRYVYGGLYPITLFALSQVIWE